MLFVCRNPRSLVRRMKISKMVDVFGIKCEDV